MHGRFSRGRIHRLDLAKKHEIANSLALRQMVWTGVGIIIAALVIWFVRDHRGLARYTYTAMAVGLALYSRVAPRQIVGLVIGIYYLHLFIANTFVGWLGGFMDVMPNRDFWALHAALVALAGVLLFVARAMFGRLLSAETMSAERNAAAVPASAH